MPYLALDLGASSGRAVVGRLRGEEGRMEMEEVHRFDTPIEEKGPRLFWDLEALWQELRAGLQAALDTAPNLKSLSVDSWAVDYVPLGADGHAPLRNPYSYRDGRTEGWMERAFEKVPAEDIFAATGIQFLPFNTLYQLLADREAEPALFEKTRLRLPIADYFHYRFGGRAVVERSMASTTQMMDAQSGTWAGRLLQRFGLSADAWPEVAPPGTALGTAQTNAQSKIEIIAGLSHDTACAVAAVPAEDAAPWAYVSSGTWSLLGAELPGPLVTEAVREAGFTNEAGLGGTARFLKNLTGLWPLQQCVREWNAAGEGEEVDYDELFAEAEAAGPARARIDLEDERFLARGGMEKRLAGYCRETGQPVPRARGQLTRAILESIAESYRRGLRSLEELVGWQPEALHLVGGGSQVELLCRLAAEATGCRVVAGPVEATALGNLLVQAHALGDLPEAPSPSDAVRQAARRSVETQTHEPDPSPR